MTDFVLHPDRFKSTDSVAVFEITNYANFLKQSLHLGMFVPCDENGKPIQRPNFLNTLASNKIESYNKEVDDYEKALSEVMLEGLEYVSKWYGTHILAKEKYSGLGQIMLSNYSTIEDIICQDLILTPNAIKQIYGTN